MLLHLCFLIILFLCQIPSHSSIDVSWLPADADGPLPLSTNYRIALGKLCALIKSGQPMPPEIREKEKVLNIWCKKLQSSSSISSPSWSILDSLSFDLTTFPSKKIVATVALAGGGTLLWLYRLYVLNYFKRKQVFPGNSINGNDDDGDGAKGLRPVDMDEVRQARIRQFQNVAAKRSRSPSPSGGSTAAAT